MAKLIIMKGLPASGKSTYARERVQKEKNTIRLNRDEMRAMFFGGRPWSGKDEKLVVDLEKLLAQRAMQDNKNVIIDDTNLGYPQKGPWVNFWSTNFEDYEVVDFTNTSISLCVQRDKMRTTGRVGRAIINRMALEKGLIDWNNIESEDNVGVKGGRNGKLIIVDIDGTVADLDHRLHLISDPTQKDYREFHKRVGDDTPLVVVCDWVRGLYDGGYTIVFVSGRGDECAVATEDWLTKHCPTYDFLFMRRGGDYRKDTLIKQEILNLLPKDRIEFVIDDRPSVIKMWKDNGLKVYPVGQDRWVGRE